MKLTTEGKALLLASAFSAAIWVGTIVFLLVTSGVLK